MHLDRTNIFPKKEICEKCKFHHVSYTNGKVSKKTWYCQKIGTSGFLVSQDTECFPDMCHYVPDWCIYKLEHLTQEKGNSDKNI